jgi:hypothetical protein
VELRWPSSRRVFVCKTAEPNTTDSASSTAIMDGTKNDIGHHETLRDEDIIGEKRIGSERVEHLRQLTPDELIAEKKLRRKIDRLIMPVVVTVYLMNYIDRNNYAAARLQGLEKDLGLVGDQYQTALSILFVGYVRRNPFLSASAKR